jgi:hypothetical protein
MQSTRYTLENRTDFEKIEIKNFDRLYRAASMVLPIDGLLSNLIGLEIHSADENLSKIDLILKEIYVSEIRFVKTLHVVLNDFFRPLSKILQNDDCHIIFNNIAELKVLHEGLVTKIITNATNGRDGITVAVCATFDEYKENLMKKYAKYLCNQKAAILRLDQLILNFNSVKEVLDNCATQSCMGRFRLNDLIKLPFQRVLKYPLLFSELNKHISDTHGSKAAVIRTLLSMNELSIYLNEVQRDIDQIHDSLQFSQYSNNIIDKLLAFGKLMRLDTLKIRTNSDQKKNIRQLALFTKALVISYPSYMTRDEDTLLINQFEITSFTCGNILFKSCKIKISNRFNKETYYDLFFENKTQMNSWVKCLEQT